MQRDSLDIYLIKKQTIQSFNHHFQKYKYIFVTQFNTLLMFKKFFILILFSLLVSSMTSRATNWLVGPGKTYTTPSQVSGFVGNGDTISIDAGVYLGDVSSWTANSLLIRGVGGMAKMNANLKSYGRKAIFIIRGNKCKIENIEFYNCHDTAAADMNWAGIRLEGLNLTVSHCYFHDNDNGILAGTMNPSSVIIEYCEFNHNGFGDGYSHNLYINHLDTLIFRYNYSHHAHIGHELKSRAHVNYILYNRFSNENTGDASYEIDIPDGGFAIVMGNIIEQGPLSDNSGMVSYGKESLSNPSPHNLYMINNTLVNNKATGTFLSVGNGMSILKIYNSIFAGVGTFLNGTPNTLDTSKNWIVTDINNCGFLNAGNYDYHLKANSGAINKGRYAGVASNGYSLTASQEYQHPANFTTRTIHDSIDIGAYEYLAPNNINYFTEPLEFNYSIQNKELFIQYDLENSAFAKIADMSGSTVLISKLSKGKNSIQMQNVGTGLYVLEVYSKENKKGCVFFLQ